MPADKITISLPEGLLEEIDDAAAATGATRSGVLQEAAAQYVARRRHKGRLAARRKRIEAAMRLADRVRGMPDLDERPWQEIREERRDRWAGETREDRRLPDGDNEA